MDALFHDLRYAARMLLRAPGFAAVAIVTLALGIGANSAIFSIISALLVRPVVFDDVDRLVWLWERAPRLGIERGPVSPADFLDWKNQSRAFENMAAYQGWDTNLSGSTRPERLHGFLVSPAFFQLLRVRPALGRTFSQEEGEPGRDDVVILSHGLWQRSFGGDRHLVGTTVLLNQRRLTVVGVMPADFDLPLTTDLWAPLALTSQQGHRRDARTLTILGRLKPGVSLGEARAEMEGLSGQLQRQYPDTNAGRTVRVVTLTEGILDEVSPRFLLLTMAAVGFVLLIVCANVASLLLARAAARGREIAIRVALGARRWRIVRQLLTESVLLAVAGGVLSVVVARWSLDLMMRSVPPATTRFIPGWSAIGLDAPVLGFTLIVSLASGLIFGLVPAAQVLKINVDASLKEGGRAATDHGGGKRARNLLVIGEMTLALVLSMGAALLVNGFDRLASHSQGFDPSNVQTLRVTLSDPSYPNGRQVETFYTRVLERIAVLPGVESAGAVSDLPWHAGANDEMSVDGHPPPSAGERFSADYRVVSANYFATLRIPLLRGRPFSEQDDEPAQRVVIISETMARRFWPAEDPLGKRVKRGPLTSDTPWLSVVGVAADVKRFWWDRGAVPTTYVPYRQAPPYTMSLVIRTRVDPASVLPAAEAQVRAVDAALPIYHIETLEQSMAESLMGVRLASKVMSAFAALALLLSVTGVYGLISFSVAQRTREIGLRMALGADRRAILHMIMGQGLKLAAVAAAMGLAASFVLSRVMASVLFGVVAESGPLLVALPVPLLLAVCAAAYLPARKAATIDPLRALRHD